MTKYCRGQKISSDKILAHGKLLVSTKYWYRQNTGVDKMLALKKCLRWQNVGTDAEGSPYCLVRLSPQLLTSPRPRWRSPSSPWWCGSLCMQSPSVALPLAALLLWADSLPHCNGLLYQPAMLKTSQILAPTKYRCPPKIHWFSPNYSSLYICSHASYQKVVKTKSDHHHCPKSVYTHMTSKIEAVIEIHCYREWGGGEGERWSACGCSYQVKVWASNPSYPGFHILSTFSPLVSLSSISRLLGDLSR